MLILAKELETCGYAGGDERFREILLAIFERYYSTWTDEKLLCSPRESMHYCNLVKRKVKLEGMPDDLILRTLINTRKASKRKN